ncbi:MAG TPA: hypothetical protein VF452_10765 [Candidatus Binatia bacterium]
MAERIKERSCKGPPGGKDVTVSMQIGIYCGVQNSPGVNTAAIYRAYSRSGNWFIE